MDPREIEDIIAREVLEWTFIKDDEIDSGPGWYKQDENGDLKFMGWPDQWATDMDAAWKLAGQLTKHGISWQISTMKDGRLGSFVELDYIPAYASYFETVEAEADEMPLAMCLALLKMVEAKKAKTADGVKTV